LHGEIFSIIYTSIRMIYFFNKGRNSFLQLISLLLFLISIQITSAQNTSHFIALDSGGNLYDVNPLNCTYSSLNICSNIAASAPGAKPLSIAISGTNLYIVDNKGKLWRHTYNTNANCTLLGSFSNTNGYYGLTVNPAGIVYAVTGTTLETYNPTTNTFTVLGNLPNTVGGDLLFYGGELYMACNDLNLLHVNLSNLASSNVLFSFPTGSNIFGFSSVSVPCSTNQAYAISSSSGSSNVFQLNMVTGSVGSSCSLPFNIYDTASIAENGSYVPPAPPTVVITQPTCATTTATVTISPVISGYTYSFNGGTYGTISVFSGLAAGSSYSIIAKDATGCFSQATAGTIGFVPTTITPTFTQVATICSGDALASLPTTSNNGVTGAWSPVISNTATNTYTFTPTAGLCASTQTMTITVNQKTTPTFTQVPAICTGDALAALPTTSNNGVTGAWSPVVSNTATNTYTFTPTAGLCANTQSMTITVNQKVTPTFTQVAPICSGSALAALPTTSNNGITGTWSPALSNTATNTYTFAPTAGLCANTQTMTITVNQKVTPTFTQVASICSGTALAALPTTSNNGITGTWSPALSNTATNTYTFAPTAGLCANTQSMTITVNQKVTPTFTQVAPICSGSTLAALPTTSNNGVTGTWSPALNNTATTTYTFTPTAGLCANTQSMIITVTQKTTPTFTQVGAICSGDALAALPTTSNNGITGTWSPAVNNTATTTYTFTPTSGLCANTQSMIILVNSTTTIPIFTQVPPICAGAILAALPTTSNNGIIGVWSPTINNMATTTYTFNPTTGICNVQQSMTIVVNQKVTPIFTQVAPVCSGSALAALPTTSNNGITGTWSPVVSNTTTNTYTFTPTAGLCANTQSMTITVNQKVTPTFTQVAPICSGTTLAALPTTSNNGITGTWSPVLNNNATTTYTFTPTTGLCANPQSMIIVVNQKVTPTFTQVAPICSGTALAALPTTSNNGITGTWSPTLNNTATTTYSFTPTTGLCANTQSMIIVVNQKVTPTFTPIAPICSGDALTALPTTSNNGITGTWSPALNNTATTTYTFTPTVGLCANTQSMMITVNQIVPAFTPVAPICLGDALLALPTTSNNGVTGTWSPLLDATTTTTYTFTPDVGQCATTVFMTIVVNELPTVILSNGVVCKEVATGIAYQPYLIDTHLSNSMYSFEWYFNGALDSSTTQSSYLATEAGTYGVIVTNTSTGCIAPIVNATVTVSNPGLTVTANATDYFNDNPTIEVMVSGSNTASYLYQLDEGLFQTSNLFTSVPPGSHTVTVIDTVGCTHLTTTLLLVNYPHFFTPNGDGYHDTWKIVGLEEQPNSMVFVFDRFGKLLKQMLTNGSGWDGTFNGKELPATDYWFTVDYVENGISKQFKSHFALKR
jgi:gliding motility-associated-like protein